MSDHSSRSAGHSKNSSEYQRPGVPRRPSSISSLSQPSVVNSISANTQTIHTPATSISPIAQSSNLNYFKIPPSPKTVAMSTEESAAKAAKVAIPRLKRSIESQEGSSKAGGRHRVTHACEPCRHRKTKCSGERPMCRHCQDFKISCYYADGKRDRVKKQFGSMTEKVADYEKTLRDLISRVSMDDAKLIRATLEKAAQHDVEEMMAETATLPSVEAEEDAEESGAESEASAGAGSTGALDRTEEDFTREGARTTGFMGKNSEITWIQRLHQENARPTSPPSQKSEPAGTYPGSSGGQGGEGSETTDFNPDLPIKEASYHLDDLSISTFEAVDPYELPTPETAQILFNTYISRVYPTFPIVGKVNLRNQFQKFMSRPSMRPPAIWLAILNLIFAISAKYSHLVQADWQADERDHLIYFSRARMLAVDGDTLFNHPDLQMIQVLGLMSYYLLATGQINRSWTLAGLAIRAATGVGLNMRNDSQHLADSLKEIRYRVWWALYILEHRLCGMTGRVNCILDDHCTTPLPAPIAEEEFESVEGTRLLSKEHQSGPRQPVSKSLTPSGKGSTPSTSTERSQSASKPPASRSPSAAQVQGDELEWAKDATPNGSLYFLHLVQLCRVTQNIFHEIYNPTAIEGSWSDIQAAIGTMNTHLDTWYRKLPSMFDFRRKQRDRDFYEFRLALGFYFYGAKQMLHRPCLCRLDRKIPNQSFKSNEFNHNAATICVNAAQDQLALIPDETNAVGLIRVGPWTTIVHLLVQSTVVLMLEISFRAHHMPEQADSILESCKKGVRWLHSLGEDNLSAARAWKLCNTMLHQATKKIGRDVHDLPDKPPRAAPSEDTSMSGNTARNFSAPYFSTTMPSSYDTSTMPALDNFTAFDPLMHYDQYFPGANMNSSQLQFQTGQQGSMQFGNPPTDSEMEFMNSMYHNAPQDNRRHGGRGMGGGNSGFG